ncbi:hypothetical protein ACFLZ3_03555 [Candidatus Omnitrophota bacterium]
MKANKKVSSKKHWQEPGIRKVKSEQKQILMACNIDTNCASNMS